MIPRPPNSTQGGSSAASDVYQGPVQASDPAAARGLVQAAARLGVGLVAEVFNAFNFTNYGCLTDFLPPEGNPNLGKPNCVVSLGRREQVGLKLNF